MGLPGALAFDVSGDLFVANMSAPSYNNVVEYVPPYTGAPIATITKRMRNPDGLAFDASGDLWVAMLANNTVVEYAPPYTRTPIAILSNRIKGPTDLTFGAR